MKISHIQRHLDHQTHYMTLTGNLDNMTSLFEQNEITPKTQDTSTKE